MIPEITERDLLTNSQCTTPASNIDPNASEDATSK